MSQVLNKEQIEDLIEECGSSPTFWRQNDMLICCPVHGESNPSMGISAEKQVCHCFSCGFKGNLPWLLFKSRPEDFRSYGDALNYFEARYEVEVRNVSGRYLNIPRYEESQTPMKKQKEPKVLPMYMIAPYMSGKETYRYFYDRGFNSDDVKRFMIGRDLDSRTVTIPIFNRNKELIGVIGRYISKHRKHNERYKIYEFERGSTVYPLDKFHTENDTAIIVEGNFDAIRMFKAGYENTLSIMSNKMTREQAKVVSDLVSKVIYVGDNDERGLSAKEKNIKLLASYGVTALSVTYPDYGKDPCDWSDSDIHKMIHGAGVPSLKIKRIR